MSLFKGKKAENHACNYLKTQGLQLVEKNYFCKAGEIDLIMFDSDELVLIEVKARKNIEHGHGAESVNHSKQKKLIKTANHFLLTRPDMQDKMVRFDIIEINFFDTKQAEINWIRDAFGLEGFSVL